MVIDEPQEDKYLETVSEQESKENPQTMTPNVLHGENANLEAIDLPWRVPTFTPKKNNKIKKLSQSDYFTGSKDIWLVDFEGFFSKTLNSLVLREICFFNFQTGRYLNYIISSESTFDFSDKTHKQAMFCTNQIHHIPDYYSTISSDRFREIADMFTLLVDKFVSKGTDKCRYLSQYFHSEVVNIEDYGAPNYKILGEKFPDTRQYCRFHSLGLNYHCSVYKAHLIAEYIKKSMNF